MSDPEAAMMLKKYGVDWWWRRLTDPAVITDPDLWWVPMALKGQYARSAFLYEVGARVDGSFEFGKPWIDLSDAERGILAKRWPMGETKDGGIASSHEGTNPPYAGWTPFLRLAFNLNLNDGTLLKMFREQVIETYRLTMNIPNPKPNAGRKMRTKNRGISWRAVELMDMVEHTSAKGKSPGFKANGSERSHISKAIADYKASI